MGKSRNYDKELRLIDRLKHENKQLKQANSKLRRQIQRLDVDRYNHLQELVQQQDAEERSGKKEREAKVKWSCYDCGKGTLKLMIVNRRDGVFYYRSCTNCSKRTKLQKFTSDVDGYTGEDDAT